MRQSKVDKLGMPRACPVEPHASCYCSATYYRKMKDARACLVEFHVACLSSRPRTWQPNVNLHGASRWHPSRQGIRVLAASVNLHGASRWHQNRGKPEATYVLIAALHRNTLRPLVGLPWDALLGGGAAAGRYQRPVKILHIRCERFSTRVAAV